MALSPVTTLTVMPSVGESLEGCGGVEFGLVQEDQVTDEGEIMLVGSGRGVGAGDGAGRDRDDPSPGGELGIEGAREPARSRRRTPRERIRARPS